MAVSLASLRWLPLALLLGFGPVAAQPGKARAPHSVAPVSPGLATRPVGVLDPCPTFSLVAGAAAVELVVYRLTGPLSLEPEAEPAIRQRLPAGASAWTPPAESCLAPGSAYAWAVRELGDADDREGRAAGEWSTPLLFAVRPAAVATPGLTAEPAGPADGSSASPRVRERPAARPRREPATDTEGHGAVPGARLASRLSVPTADAALRAAQGATSGDAIGVLGITASPDGAGLAAMNLDPGGGADLVLDGSAQGAGDTALDQSSMVVGGPSFDIGNATGDLLLTLDGVPVLTTATDQGTAFVPGNQLQLTAGVLDVVEGPGSGLDADTLDGIQASEFLTASTDLWVDTSGDTMTGDLVLSGATTDLVLGGAIRKGVQLFLHDIGAASSTGLGQQALQTNAGTGNTGIGAQALQLNTGGSSNTAVGAQALFFNTTGGGNTAVGTAALSLNQTASDSTAVGFQALSTSTGGGNTALGSGAMATNTAGVNNVAAGARALTANSTGVLNVAVGHSALAANTSGALNTALGGSTLENNTTGQANTAVGFFALHDSATASNNTAVGYQALSASLADTGNTAVGFEALKTTNGGGTNTAVGDRALRGNTTGSRNTAVGSAALSTSTTGNSNTAVGFLALSTTTSSYATAVGTRALAANTAGYSNTAVGSSALRDNLTGNHNTAVGSLALFSTTSGSGNTAVGRRALAFGTSGTSNTAVGHEALMNGSSADSTALGFEALRGATGSNNIGIGRNGGGSLGSGSNNIMIGSAGASLDSSTIRIGGSQTRAFIAGIRGRTTGNANAIPVLIDSLGQLGTVSSSLATKRDVSDLDDSLGARLLALRPVSFRYRDHPPDAAIQYGLIAEEVAEVFPELVVYDDEGRPETVRYHLLSTLLLDELQRQAERSDDLTALVRVLAGRLDRLEGAMQPTGTTIILP
jgi:trimeric autotransporter adhesin